MDDERRSLDEALQRSEKRGSFYWLFLAKRGKARRREYLVEVRVDLPPNHIEGVLPPDGWTVARVDTARGMVFLQRRQALRNADLRQMFSTMLAYAFEQGGRFHSWIHEASDRNLLDRFEKRARAASRRIGKVGGPASAR